MVKYAVSDDGKNGHLWPKSLFHCIRDGMRVWNERSAADIAAAWPDDGGADSFFFV